MSITDALLLLTTALGLAFAIERFLEAVNGLIKRLGLQVGPAAEARYDAIETEVPRRYLEGIDALIEQTSAALAEALAAGATNTLPTPEDARSHARATAEDLAARIKAIDPTALPAALRDYRQALLDDVAVLRTGEPPRAHEAAEDYPPVTVLLEPAAPCNPEKTAQGFWLQMIGTFAGIVICFVADFGLFEALGVFHDATPEAATWHDRVRHLFDIVLTGVLIGAGAEPIHVLIKFLDRRGTVDLQAPALPQPAPDEAPAQAAPSVPSAPAVSPARLLIPYEGGVDPELVARRQPKREAPPDVIVFHHTAMHSDTSFEDVVRVIQEQRGWATAYHCVVLADGSIHPFCRWDYVGNHARGANFRSIGVTLNGNFETNPATPGANDGGQFGLQTPSDAQLESAARVTALWCYLYDIPVDFPEHVAPGIIPHKTVKPTACPGSNFPYARFETLVRTIHADWTGNAAMQDAITRFRQKAHLYPHTA